MQFLMEQNKIDRNCKIVRILLVDGVEIEIFQFKITFVP